MPGMNHGLNMGQGNIVIIGTWRLNASHRSHIILVSRMASIYTRHHRNFSCLSRSATLVNRVHNLQNTLEYRFTSGGICRDDDGTQGTADRCLSFGEHLHPCWFGNGGGRQTVKYSKEGSGG